jgi:hypothetical protein
MTATTTATTPTATGTTSTKRSRWPFTGVAAGALGVAATLITDIHVPETAGRTSQGAVEEINRGLAHVGGVLGYLTVACLLVLAAAWRRRVEPAHPNSTAVHVVSGAITASAAALTLGYAWKLSMALYLPGGLNGTDGGFDQQGLYIYYVLNDFGPYIGWLGVVIAAGAVAWMSLRERLLSRWIGVLSVLPVLAVTAAVGAGAIAGFPGVVGPLWMIVAFAGIAFSKRRLDA